jgi:NADH dehydrogenase
MNVLVIGGSGFVGSHLVAALAARGARVTIPCRRRERAKALILLPTVEVIETNVSAPAELGALVAGRDAVISLAGVLHGPDFARVHVELPQAIARACRERGVRRLLHMSAVGAAPDAPSEYLRTKGMGERAVLAAPEIDATVLRPSVIFGPNDSFLNQFSGLLGLFPVFPIPSPQAKFQPVYVGDVVAAMLAALDSRETCGKAYDLCGPRVYTMEELVRFVCRVTGRRRLLIPLSDRLSFWQARLMTLWPWPLITLDNYLSMKVPSTSDQPFPFGIVPASLEAVAPSYLAPAGPRERYSELRWHARR